MRTRTFRLLSLAVCVALLLTAALPGATPALAQEPVIDVPPGELPVEPEALPAGASAAGTVTVGSTGDGEVAAAASPDQPNVGFTIKVNTLVDEWDTDPNQAPKTKCSLREALQATVQTPTPTNQGCGKLPPGFTDFTLDLIPGTYLLTKNMEMPHVTVTTRINGKNAVTIDGGGKQGRNLGIFTVVNAKDSNNDNKNDYGLYLEKLTLQHGYRYTGGAIRLDAGAVILREVTIKRNFADNGVGSATGGGISAGSGELTCIKSKFIENTVRGDGGGVYTGSVLALYDRCEFQGNQAESSGGAMGASGGGEHYPIIRDTKFRDNFVYSLNNNDNSITTDTGGGAIWNTGKMLIERSEFFQNYTRKAKGGGAIRNQGELRIQDSAFTKNEARIEGAINRTFGGALLNEGTLFLVRVSIYNNEAYFGGGIMNRQTEDLIITNSTIAQNSASFDGGIANGEPGFDDGGEVEIYHTTIVRNEDNAGGQDPLQINSASNYKITIGNSILDSGCGSIIYSLGGNVFKGETPLVCNRIPPGGGPDLTATDFFAEYTPDIGLEGLNNNGGPGFDYAEFKSIKIDTDSAAVDLGDFGPCQHPLMEGKDQIQGPRPTALPDKCDSGAMEVGSSPAKFESDPAAGSAIVFPSILAGGQPAATTKQLKIRNTGGGAIQWTAIIDESWDGTFEVTGAQTSGALIGKQPPVELTLTCKATQPGSYYGMLLITTDMQDQPEIRYKLTCHAPGSNSPYAGAQQKPGPMSAGSGNAGETTQVSANVLNAGDKPMTTSYNWKQTAGNVWQLVGSKAAVAAASPGATETLLPGEELKIDAKCTPPGKGLFFNTLEIKTNDPLNPVIEYDISCEGRIDPTPETLAMGPLSAEPSQVMPIALSADGTQLAAGHWDDTNTAFYAVNPVDGSLTPQGLKGRPGMATITGVEFSKDGQNVYMASRSGDGVVVADRDPGSGAIQVTDAFTRTTVWICGVNPIKFCSPGTMDGARGMDISPDDRHLYVTGQSDGTLTVLNRITDTGAISFRQNVTATVAHGNLLTGAWAVLVSPDGNNVYASGAVSDTVLAFSRNQETGRLSLLTYYKDNTDGADALDDVRSLALSPDGRFLYAGSYAGNAIQIFARNPEDGFITPAGVETGVPAPYTLEISHDPDGERMVVAGWTSDRVLVYGRDLETGELTPQQELSQGLNGPVSLVSTADDRFVYAGLFEGKGVQLLRSVRNAPGMANVSPASVIAGGPDVTVSVIGTNFYPDSKVLFNGGALPTTFVHDRQLDAVIPANLVSAAGNHLLRVRTPTVTGDLASAGLPFNVVAPNQPAAPSIETINPPAANYGNEALNVVITGANFRADSQVLLNGGPVKTTYISPSILLVELEASDVASPGPLAFSIVNGAPPASAAAVAMGDVQAAAADATTTSRPFLFSVAEPNTPAQPAVSGFAPGSINAGSGEQWLTVTGANFSTLADAVSVLYWNGEPRDTSIVDSKTLLVRVLAGDLAAAGNVEVTVRTPGVPESLPATLKVQPAGSNPQPGVASSYVDFGALQGQAGPWLAISGQDFVNGASVRLNGQPRPTVFVNPYLVLTRLTFADLQKAWLIRVANPGPGGGQSNGITYVPVRLQYLPLVD